MWVRSSELSVAASSLRLKPTAHVACVSTTHAGFSFLLCGLSPPGPPRRKKSLEDNFHEFRLNSLTLKWELRPILPALLKIEISQDRRTITGSCFPGVSCQLESLPYFKSESSSHQRAALVYARSIYYFCSTMGWCQSTSARFQEGMRYDYSGK